MNSTGTAGTEAGESEKRQKIRGFCTPLWQAFFPDLPFTTTGLKRALFTSTAAMVLLLTLAGLLLRLWHIGDVSFWLDEAVTSRYAGHSFIGIWEISTTDNNPPVFYWIEHAMLLFGSGEAVLRLIPALLGALTIPVFYLLGREFHNRETGIVACALLTFSVFHITYSQEARPYTLLLFSVSLALLFCLRAIRTDSRSTWLLFGFFSAIACWSHLFGFVMVFSLFAAAFVFRYLSRETPGVDLRPVMLAGAVWFVLSLPMLVLTLAAGISRIAETDPWGVRGTAVITSVLSKELGPSVRVEVLLIFLFLLGLVRLLRNDRYRFLFLVIATALPFVVTVVLSYKMSIAARYLIGLLPLFFLGIAYCIGSFRFRIGTIRLSCIAILVLVALSVLPLANYYSLDVKNGQDWKRLTGDLQNRAGAGDLILVFPGFDTTPLTYYYSNETAHTIVCRVDNETDLDRLATLYPDQKKWLIVAGSTHSSGAIGRWTATHAELIEHDQELYLYRIYPGQ